MINGGRPPMGQQQQPEGPCAARSVSGIASQRLTHSADLEMASAEKNGEFAISDRMERYGKGCSHVFPYHGNLLPGSYQAKSRGPANQPVVFSAAHVMRNFPLSRLGSALSRSACCRMTGIRSMSWCPDCIQGCHASALDHRLLRSSLHWEEMGKRKPRM